MLFCIIAVCDRTPDGANGACTYRIMTLSSMLKSTVIKNGIDYILSRFEG